MKRHYLKFTTFILFSGLFAFYSSRAFAQSVLFDFDNAPLHSPFPIDLTVGGINAHFSANPPFYNYSIQRPTDVIGFAPVGFAGYCISPNTINLCDLLISFDHTLVAASIMYAPQELDTDSSCTMRITAYLGATFVGTNTYRIPVPGTWPTGTLSFSSTQPFDHVVIHYDAPPVTGGDYGVIFLADNLTVTIAATPSPTPAPINISGTVSYCSNPIPGPVPNVALGLTGSGSSSILSDSSGNYLFSSLPIGGTYNVTPTKTSLTPASAGINTMDVLATQRHFLGIAPLSGCRLTAADVNGDTNVNTIDILAIQRFFLGLSTGVANTGNYLFTPASSIYTGITTDQTAQNYDALVFGDVASPFAE